MSMNTGMGQYTTDIVSVISELSISLVRIFSQDDL